MTGNRKSTQRSVQFKLKDGEDRVMAKARKGIDPKLHAATAIADYAQPYGDIELKALVDALEEQVSEVGQGDLSRPETMLTAQAHTLDAIFNNLARQAYRSEHMENLDRYLKLALKAQAQCRTTLEVLAKIKHPPIAGYVKQANIAHGPQQVNNLSDNQIRDQSSDENGNPQNKLLEEIDGQRLDTGATCASGQADQAMAAVGKIHRTKKCSR